MSAVGVAFGFLIIFGGNQEAITFEDGYQCVIRTLKVVGKPPIAEIFCVELALVRFEMVEFSFWGETEPTQWAVGEREVNPQSFLQAC